MYDADIGETDADIEATVGNIKETTIQTERPDNSTEVLFLRTQETNVEPPAKRFRQKLRRKVNQKSVKSISSD